MWNWKWAHGLGRPLTAEQWAPSLVAKDPTPPIPLLVDGGALEGRATVVAALTAADHQGAVAFDAAADALQLTGGSFPANNSDYTIAVWVRRKAGTQDPSFIVENDAAGTTLALALNANVPGLLNGSGFIWNVTIGSALLADVWYFLAMRVSGTTGTITRGGETEPCTHASGTIVAQAAAFRMWFGGTTSTFFPTADLSMIQCWDRVLTDGELELERQSPSPVARERLAGDFRLATAESRLADLVVRQHLTAPGVGPWATTDGPTLGRDTALAGTVVSVATVSADLTTSAGSSLGGALTGTAVVAGNLTTAIQLASSISGTATVAGALTTNIALAAAATGTAATSASLTTAIRLAAALTGTATVAGGLTTGILLAGAVSGVGTASASLTTAIQLAAAVSGVASVAGDLTVGSSLAGALSASATVTAALTTAIRLAAAATGTASTTGSLNTAIQLQAGVSGTATVTASLTTTPASLAGSVTGTASCTTALTTGIQLGAAATGTSTVAGALTTSIRLAGSVTGTATASASLSAGNTSLAISVTSTSTVTASLTTSISLAASPAASATLAGDLTTAIQLQAALVATATVTAALFRVPVAGGVTLLGNGRTGVVLAGNGRTSALVG